MVSYLGLSYACVEIKLEGSSGGYEMCASGSMVDMVTGLITLGMNKVAVAAAAARASDIISGVGCL